MSQKTYSIPHYLSIDYPKPIILMNYFEFEKQLKNEASDLTAHRHEKIAKAMANRSAARFQQRKLNPEEMNSLIGQLFASSNPNYSPNGEEISQLLPEMSLKNLFS